MAACQRPSWSLLPHRVPGVQVPAKLVRLKITKELGALPRQGLRLETNDAGMVKHVHLAGADGSAMSFEMNRVGYTTRFADRLITALSQSS